MDLEAEGKDFMLELPPESEAESLPSNPETEYEILSSVVVSRRCSMIMTDA